MPFAKMVFWHRDLPPLDAAVMAEHTVEANSNRVPGTLAHRDDLWDGCYQDLMANATSRVAAEVVRLGGRYAHVHGESIGVKHDDVAGEAWLHGTFTYVLYSAGDGHGAIANSPPGSEPDGDSHNLKV